MTRLVCFCCKTPPLHAHGRECEAHPGAPVVPLPPPLGTPGGEDCTGLMVTKAIDAWCVGKSDVIRGLYGRARDDRMGGGGR